jgi:BirA family biotin operon repressor/biotin-[acetyl-CoA-carboxylase] ligase
MQTPVASGHHDLVQDARLAGAVRVLADGRFHSGSALGSAAGVSRAAVWKLIERLRDVGVPVDAVRGRGYRLRQPVELLEAGSIGSQVTIPVDVAFSCASTNGILLDRARAGEGNQVLLAELQSAGRGRWGRHWVSPFGSALCLSLLWRFPPLPHGLAGLSLAVGVCVAEALALAGAPVRLKWPNDLMLEGRKLGGILIEIAGEMDGPCAAVIGLGLNLTDSRTIADQAAQPAADLALAIGEGARQRNRLAALVVAAIERACRGFADQGLAPFLPLWQRYDMFFGSAVVLLLPDQEVRGIARGVDARGALLLERDGRIESCFSGDLRLRMRRDTTA